MSERERAQAYERAWQGLLAVRQPAPGVLRAAGADRLSLLQRLSTNDLTGLGPMATRATVLTTALARIVDVVQVVELGEAALLLCSAGRGAAVRAWLQRYILFRDDVQLDDASGRWSRWSLLGPQAEAALAELAPGAQAPGGGGVAAFAGGLAWRIGAPAHGGLSLLLDEAGEARARARWPTGADEDEAYQALRIEAGLPEAGREIDGERLPPEVGLQSAVSLGKGCYIGQEILARMDTRGKLAWRLAGVRLEALAPPGVALFQAGAQVGELTSTAVSPRRGPVGLAVVRPAALARDEGAVTLDGAPRGARLVELPMDADG
jgi:folate-binding protein YgfZ